MTISTVEVTDADDPVDYCCSKFFSFKIPKYAKSTNKYAIILRIIQLFIVILTLTAIGVYIWKEEAFYKTSSTIQSQIVMDQFGYFWTNFSKDQFDVNLSDDELALYNKFWVPNDYIRQGYDEQVFIVYMNFGVKNVSLGICPENPQYDVVICDPKNNTQCINGNQSPNGIQTGKCVKTDLPLEYIELNRSYVCDVQGWCPVAYWPPLKRSEGPLLRQTKDTILSIQNFITFPEFGVQRRTSDRADLDCLYDPIKDNQCPYFKLEDIVKYSYYNNKSYEEIATYAGAIFEIRIDWNCTLSFYYKCDPEFSFWRRDHDNSDLLSFWEYEKLNPTQRVLTYGWRIKFQIVVTGFAKQFDLFVLLRNIFAYGSAIGLVMTIFVWFVIFYTKESNLYDNAKLCDRKYRKSILNKFYHCIPCLKKGAIDIKQ